MKCPSCGYNDSKVIDSRPGRDGRAIRRRRECLNCSLRFTTYERIEELFPVVLKKDGRREPYDQEKLLRGIGKACDKRPISMAQREELASRILRELQESGEREVTGKVIGEKVMRELHRLDKIAYVRFASVYRQFEDVTDFMDEIKGLLGERKDNEFDAPRSGEAKKGKRTTPASGRGDGG
jgi:transcriptional repressor NrdR